MTLISLLIDRIKGGPLEFDYSAWRLYVWFKGADKRVGLISITVELWNEFIQLVQKVYNICLDIYTYCWERLR